MDTMEQYGHVTLHVSIVVLMLTSLCHFGVSIAL